MREVLFKEEGKRFTLEKLQGAGRGLCRRAASVHTRRQGADSHLRHRWQPWPGSVAWGAARAGIKAVIYVHETVSEGRAAAIASFGATVVREGPHL